MGHRIPPTPPGPLLLTPSLGFRPGWGAQADGQAASPSLAQFLPLFLYLPSIHSISKPSCFALLDGMNVSVLRCDHRV